MRRPEHRERSPEAKPLSRRRFLLEGAAAAGALAAPLIVPARILGLGGEEPPSETVAIGCIGTGGRAKLLIRQMPRGGRIVAVCDVYLRRCDEAKREFADRSADWLVYQDYRKLLDDPEVEAVFIATPHYLHGPMAIDAIHAGKHVYCEKAMAYTIGEN